MMHRHLLHNGKIYDSRAILLSPGQVGLLNGWGVFSTVRVVRGVLFAFERHFRRMRRDADLMRIPFPGSLEEMEKPLLELVEANGAFDAALRVVVVRNRGGLWEGPAVERDFDLIAFTADLKEWGSGARIGLVPNARFAASPFAGTKILSWSYNLTWLEEAQARGLDEVVLLNERGEVSECTSANIFIAEGNQVWTPPLAAGCLPGVTREILLEEIRVPGISIGERPLRPEELESADEVFITSTTRGLLPVLAIEGLKIQQRGKTRKPLEEAFLAYVDRYVAQARMRALPAGVQ
jgi:branched-chain amino acid aminotransferase